MWHCKSCDYWNEEWDTTCAKCNGDREALELAASSGSDADQPTTGPDSAPAVAGRRRLTGMEWAIIAIILICVATLGWLGYSAWHQGRLSLNLRLPARTGGPAAPTAPTVSYKQQAIAGDHPLALVYTAKVKGLKQYQGYADAVLEMEQRFPVAADSLPGLTGVEFDVARLDDLAAHGSGFLESYRQFEAQCLAQPAEALLPYQQLLRTGYISEFDRLLGLIGEYYIQDDTGVHPGYMLSDEVADVVDGLSPEDAPLLRQRWAEVVYARTQRMLDAELAEEIGEISYWLETMTTLHQGFQREQAAIPAYNARNGILDTNAKASLDLLESLLNDIEILATGFAEYKAGINDHGRSDQVKSITSQFEQLAQADHLYAFTEIYRIYAQDRRLVHPVYAELARHLDFVVQNWPTEELEYRRVYVQYEGEWRTNWGD